MVSIDYCILTMEIMEIYHKCSSDNIPKYWNDKGSWIFSNYILFDFDFWCFNATFNNISAISWRPVSVVKKARIPGENYRPWASNW
jgi:hypothetical protein